MVDVREPNFRLVHATTFTTLLGTRAKIRRCLPQAGEKPRKSEETTTVRDPLKKRGKKITHTVANADKVSSQSTVPAVKQ